MISICIVSHEAYLKNLDLILSFWDSFAPKDWNRIISLDGCSFDNSKFPNWKVIENPFSGNPCDPRNNALAEIESGYVVFWDADNIPTKEYVEAIKLAPQKDPEVFCWYPKMELPYPSEDIRLSNYIDTASLLSVEMLRSIGGWKKLNFCEDWELFLRAKSHNFRFEPLGASFVYCRHDESRTNKANLKEDMLPIRSVGIIGLLRGDITLTTEWLESVASHKYFSKTGITIVDKSGHKGFSKWLKSKIYNLNFDRITYLKDEAVSDDSFSAIHNSVGKSYALALQSTPEDLILTWEDDVIPLKDDYLKNLVQNIYPLSRFRVIGSQVPSREDSSKIIASVNKERWSGFVDAEDYKTISEIGMLGGGFTLWHRQVLEKTGFQGMRFTNSFPHGWDGWLCKRINENYLIGMYPDKCKHER